MTADRKPRPKAKAPTPAPAAAVSKSETLVNKLKPQQSTEAAMAELVVAGLASNAVITKAYSKFPFSDLDLTACLNSIVDATERVNHGDLGDAEALLMAQAVSLNAIFVSLANRAGANMGEYLDATDRYLRLALKAQGQCRTTIETLAVIRNPPVFARQANIAHGPQQVNNGVPAPARDDRARGEESESRPNELLEAHGERVDSGAKGSTSESDSRVAAVEVLNGSAHD